MEKLSGIVYGLVSLVVIILIVATVAIPVVETSQADLITKEQNTGQRYTVLPTTDEYVFSSSASAALVNGEPLTEYIENPLTTTYYIATENTILSIAYTGSTWSTKFAVYSTALEDSGYIVQTSQTLSVTFSDGIMTISETAEGSEFEVTAEYTNLYFPSESGNYGSWAMSSLPMYVDSTSKVLVLATAYSQGSASLVYGTLDNLVPTLALSNHVLYDEETATATYTKANNGASNELTAFTMSSHILYSSSTSTLIAPIDYSVLTSENSIYSTLLGLVPILLMLIPLLIVVKLVSNRRD